jgi:Zn-finger nucleic acid-binding protein
MSRATPLRQRTFSDHNQTTRAGVGIDPEPDIRGRHLADRELDSVFARNDEGKYDAPAAKSRREQDDVEQLRHILERHLDKLSQARREILVESFFGEGKRADIAARRGITVSTYDNHRQAAFKALRESLAADVEASTGIDRSIWYDRVEELIERRAARLRGGSSSDKHKLSKVRGKGGTSRGEGANSEDERASSEDEGANLQGARDNARGERRHAEGERRAVKDEGRAVNGEADAVKGERANAAHDRDNDQHESEADEPVSDTSSGARNESEPARPRVVTRSLQSRTRTRLHATATPRGTT